MGSVLQFPGLEGGEATERLPVDQDITASAIIDLNGMIQSVNSDFTSLVRYSRYDLAGMRWTDCGHPDDAETEASVMADLLVGTLNNAQIPRRLIAKDGTVVYGSLRLSPLRDAQGEPISLFAVFTAFATSGAGGRGIAIADGADNDGDLAETAIEDGRAADTSTRELVTLLNHEFRTPLNAIIGFAEMMDRETYGALGDPHYRQYAKYIHESGGRLLEFLSDMLDLVISDTTALHLTDAVIDPQAPVEALLVQADVDQGADRVAKAVDRVSGGMQLMADPQVMTRILSFLVADAIRSSDDDEQVSVTVDESALDGGLTYTIVNAGCEVGGLPVDGAFGRLTEVKDGDHSNTRLGLPLCKWLVRLHGGDLDVDRSGDAGTKVHVRLPESRVLRQTATPEADTAKQAI